MTAMKRPSTSIGGVDKRTFDTMWSTACAHIVSGLVVLNATLQSPGPCGTCGERGGRAVVSTCMRHATIPRALRYLGGRCARYYGTQLQLAAEDEVLRPELVAHEQLAIVHERSPVLLPNLGR